MQYFGGFIDGFGEWRLEPRGRDTRVIYRLEARAHGWLVVLLGKMFNLAHVHSRSMQTVLKNLKHALDQKHHMATEVPSLDDSGKQPSDRLLYSKTYRKRNLNNSANPAIRGTMLKRQLCHALPPFAQFQRKLGRFPDERLLAENFHSP